MKFIKKHIIMENILFFTLAIIATLSISRLLGGYFQDKITKSTCSALNGVYVIGDSIGHSYCDKK